MGLSEPDIKKLWGLAAGLCSHPECDYDCIEFIDPADPTVLGEMAHIIAKAPSGPRGVPTGGEDTYENTILLCPFHHRLIDKAPKDSFPDEMLHEWKIRHELSVRERLSAVPFDTKHDLGAFIALLLAENHAAWAEYGPESNTAKNNPSSNVSVFWMLRKLSYVIPNNTRIVKALRANRNLLSLTEYKICTQFIEHAAGFERSAYERLDKVPRFPVEFEKLMETVAE